MGDPVFWEEKDLNFHLSKKRKKRRFFLFILFCCSMIQSVRDKYLTAACAAKADYGVKAHFARSSINTLVLTISIGRIERKKKNCCFLFGLPIFSLSLSSFFYFFIFSYF